MSITAGFESAQSESVPGREKKRETKFENTEIVLFEKRFLLPPLMFYYKFRILKNDQIPLDTGDAL